MLLTFSVQDHTSLFGVGFDLNTQLERLQAAEHFYQVRKEIERNKTRLASLTARNFKKAASNFRENVEEAVKEGTDSGRRSLLLPLVQDNGTADGVRHFVLACLTLSKGHCKNLERANLITIFPQLFREVVGAIVVPSETMTAIMAIVEEVCTKIDSPSSKRVLGESSPFDEGSS